MSPSSVGLTSRAGWPAVGYAAGRYRADTGSGLLAWNGAAGAGLRARLNHSLWKTPIALAMNPQIT